MLCNSEQYLPLSASSCRQLWVFRLHVLLKRWVIRKGRWVAKKNRNVTEILKPMWPSSPKNKDHGNKKMRLEKGDLIFQLTDGRRKRAQTLLLPELEYWDELSKGNMQMCFTIAAAVKRTF